MRNLTIAGRRIGDDAPCYIIAEIGSNHQGRIDQARQLIRAATEAGVDAVKFQKRENSTLYTPEMLATHYEHAHSFGPTYGAHREALELSGAALRHLRDQTTVAFLATPFDEASVDVLAAVGVDGYKIASGGLTDAPLLRYVAQQGKPIVLSTGGGTIADVDRAIQIVTAYTSDLAVLHCTAAYPAEFETLNLRVIETYRDRYPTLVIGWSCHIHNLSMLMMAFALGARVLEVHVTLNRSLKGTDQAFSLEPATLRKLVKDVQRAPVALGDGVKAWQASEQAPIAKMRRVETPWGRRISGEPLSSSTSTAPSARPTGDATRTPAPIGTGSRP